MVIKLIGLFLIAAAGTGAGLYAASRLSQRAGCLEQVLRLIDMTQTELRYSALPLPELVRKAARDPELDALPFLGHVEAALREGYNPDRAWEQALTMDGAALEKTDRELVADFGRGLGKSDVQGQLAHCDAFRERLSRQAAQAREDTVRKGKLYMALGVIGGLALALLLL